MPSRAGTHPAFRLLLRCLSHDARSPPQPVAQSGPLWSPQASRGDKTNPVLAISQIVQWGSEAGRAPGGWRGQVRLSPSSRTAWALGLW